MTVIQIILTLVITLLAVYMYLRLRSTLLDVLLIFLFFSVGIFFTLFPDTTTVIANKVGVSRGADMIFYLSILFLFFLVLKLYSRIRRLEQRFTEKVRKESIEQADKLS